MRVLYTGGGVERWVEDAEEKLIGFRQKTGYWYLRYRPLTPPNQIVVEDLGVTVLVNSQIKWRSALSIIERGEIDLSTLPSTALEETTADERREVAELIGVVAQWPGFGASTASKVLHKKRPGLIPTLDNQAIFGAYLNPKWDGEHRAPSFTVKRVSLIQRALDDVHRDLTCGENEGAWTALAEREPEHTRLEIFDTVWWVHFRDVQPIRRRARQ